MRHLDRPTRGAVLVLMGVLVQAAACAEAKAVFSGISPVKGEAVVLVSPEKGPAPILIPAGADQNVKRAADGLAKVLGQISGATFEAAEMSGPLPDRAIVVCQASDAPLKAPADLSDEGFLIRTSGQRLFLIGGTPHSTRVAVYGLLEDQLGCRWWARDAEFVPSAKTISVAAQDTHVEPAFRRHGFMNNEATSTENDFRWKRRTTSLLGFTGSHNLCPMLKPYAEKNPEFLPMNDKGERAFNNLHMNYTAAGMSEALAEIFDKQIEKRDGNIRNVIFFAGMGDWYGGMDLSPESKAIYEEETWTDPDGRKKPGYIATLLRMMNKTAELLEAEHPGVIVGTFAYMSLEAPPAKTQPRHNVAIRVPRLRHDTVRSVLESEKNRSFQRNIERWCELAPGRVYVWEYGANFSHFIKPFPCLRSMAENAKYYHSIGIDGVMIQGNYVSTGGDLAVLKNYVWSKILWDPARDVDELVREFCEGYYGAAAEEMIAYVNLIENSVRGEKPISADEFDQGFRWITPEVLAEAKRLFAKAVAKTGGTDEDPIYVRLREARVSIDAFELWTEGPLKEVGEQLVRADFGEPTLDRVRDMLKYARKASVREWSSYLGYHQGLLATHGGPMPTLTAGDVTVKCHPMSEGSIYRLLLGDKVAVDGSQDSPGARNYLWCRKEGNRVEMTPADLSGKPDADPTQAHGYRLVELGEDGVVKVTGRLARQGKDGSYAPKATTVYDVAGRPESIELQYQTADGKWQTLTVSNDAPQADIPRANHLRIARKDRGVVVDDRYAAEGDLAGVLEYDRKGKKVRTVVNFPTVEIPKTQKTAPYGPREIRLEPLK